MSAPANAAAVLALMRAIFAEANGQWRPVDRVPALPEESYPLCRRGRHRLTPDNLSGRPNGMSCRACKVEYNQARRAGQPWDGPGRLRGAGSMSGQVFEGPLSPEEVARLRAVVGACPECGWAQDEDTEAHACALALADREVG